MDNADFPTQLLGLEKLQVVGAEFIDSHQIHLTVEACSLAANCSDCGHISTRLHDLSAAHLIRGLPIGERQCYLRYQARRFKCEFCAKTFVKRVTWRRPQASYTERYEQHVYQRVRRTTVSQVAHDEGLSEEATQALFEQWAKKRLSPAVILK